MSITFEDLDRDGLITAVKSWAKSCHEIELQFVDSEERNKELQERVKMLEGERDYLKERLGNYEPWQSGKEGKG